jgi:hypothetical protein
MSRDPRLHGPFYLATSGNRNLTIDRGLAEVPLTGL